MEELRIAVCEDNPEEFEKLLLLIQSSGIPVRTGIYENGEAFLAEYHPGLYDLILMDIYLDGISGVDTILAVRSMDPEIPVAFITASKDHALEGYRLNVARYIEKPVTGQAVADVLQLACEKKQNAPGLQILHNGKPLSVPFRKMLYIEQKAHYLLFHLTDGQTLRSHGTLDKIETSFAALPFLRCHKSYLVNLTFVTGLDKELMIFRMVDGTNVHIRRESLKKAKDAWETYLFQTARKDGRNHA